MITSICTQFVILGCCGTRAYTITVSHRWHVTSSANSRTRADFTSIATWLTHI
jgi:hypothetical protein